jgi:hypothetical protein
MNVSIPEELELFTLAQVSAIAKRHRTTLYRDMDAGLLHTVMIGGRRRVARPELERYLHTEGQETRQREADSGKLEPPTKLPRRKT